MSDWILSRLQETEILPAMNQSPLVVAELTDEAIRRIRNEQGCLPFEEVEEWGLVTRSDDQDDLFATTHARFAPSLRHNGFPDDLWVAPANTLGVLTAKTGPKTVHIDPTGTLYRDSGAGSYVIGEIATVADLAGGPGERIHRATNALLHLATGYGRVA